MDNQPDLSSLIPFLEGAVSIVTLIVFFVMAYNLGQIKKTLMYGAGTRLLDAEYRSCKSLNQREKAAAALLKLIFLEFNNPDLDYYRQKACYAELKEKYEIKLKELGVDFPILKETEKA